MSDTNSVSPSGAIHPTGDAGLPPRRLNAIDTTFVVIGAIVGVGIFFNPAQVARLAGSSELALLAWCIGGAIALCGALTFASLGSVYHGPGAQYDILRDTYGPLTGFLFVFCNATAIQAGAIAIIALVCVDNIAFVFGDGQLGAKAKVALAAAIIVALAVANIVGVRGSATIQILTVLAKCAVLAAIIGLALSFSAPSPASAAIASQEAGKPTDPLALVVFSAIVPAFFAYGGWQHALWISGEVRNPRRSLPLGIVTGVSVVVLVYVAVNWAYFGLLGYAGVAGSGALAADAAKTVWPSWGGRAIAAGVAVSAFGVLNAQLLSGPRLIYRLAHDGRFFSPFARIAPNWGTPYAAILLLGGLALLLLFFAGRDAIDRLTTGVVFLDGLFFILTGIAVFVLRARGGEFARAALRLGYPIAPALFVVGELGLVIGAHRDEDNRAAANIGLLWVAGAAILYFVAFRARRPRAND